MSPEKKPKPGTGTKKIPGSQGPNEKKRFINIDPARVGQMLGLSLVEIESELKPLWDAIPYMQNAEDLHQTPGYLRKTMEDIDEEEFYDTPDMEKNIETDWVDDLLQEPASEPSEDFLQYAWRKWEEDFFVTRDEKAERVAVILDSWSTTNAPLILDEQDQDLQSWFDLVMKECPGRAQKKQKRIVPQPDIIFSISSEGNINYEINLGYLDQISVSPDMYEYAVPWGIYDIPLGIVNNLRKTRRDALSLMGEYLIEKQNQFICSETMDKALKKLKPRMQNDFIEFAKQKKIKKEKTWANRVIANKMVKLPFSNQLFPLAFFFNNMTMPKLICLQKAFDLHIIKGGKKPLTSLDQTKILQALSFNDINDQQVRHTLWKHLQQIYPPDLWESLKIVGDAGKTKTDDHLPKDELDELIKKIAEAYPLPFD